MNLNEYLKYYGLSAATFAKQYGLPYTSVWRIITGKNTPSLRLALEIERVTKGQVTLKALLNGQ